MRAAFVFGLSLLLLTSCAEPDPEPVTRYSASHGKTPDGSVDLLVLEDAEAEVVATIAPEKGGELSSLRIKISDDWVETLYLAEDYSAREGWTGKAPLLWPATGRNFPAGFKPLVKADGSIEKGRWEINGRQYEMPGHGFAHDMPWKVEQLGVRDGAFAAVSFEDSEETRTYYAFGFRIEVEYTLSGGDLDMAYTISADEDNDGEMPFAIGNHITFNTPLIPGGDAGSVVFKTPSDRMLLRGEGGLPTGEGTARSHADGIALKDFEVKEAISLTGYSGDPWIELIDPQGLTVRMSHKADRYPEQPFIQYNVWGSPGEGYFSPEPLVGLQHSFVLDKGMTRLAPGESWHWTIRVELKPTGGGN